MLCVGVFVAGSSYGRGDGSATGNDAFFYLKRQLIWAVLAIVALLIGMRPLLAAATRWLPITAVGAVLVTIVLIPDLD